MTKNSNAPVPASAINRLEPGFVERWLKTVEELTRKTQFIGGEPVAKLEAELSKLAGVRETRSCANGTDALQVALRALGVGPGDLVLVPDMTFWATFETVCTVGARPVTVDVDPQTLHPTAALFEEAINKFKPKAAMLVHLFGWPAPNTLEIRELCKKKGVLLIEDSAQAWGTEIAGRPLFADALISTTSFYPGKVLGAAGDGGALFCNDKALADKVWKLCNHGRISKYEYSDVGYNSRMDTLQAAFLLQCLDYLDARLDSRRRACQWYRDNLKGLPIQMLSPAAGSKENGYISVALAEPELRTRLLKGLEEHGIGYQIVYPGPMSRQPGATPWLHGKIDHGHADKACRSVLNLPCFAYITDAELQRVKSVLEGLCQK